MSKPERTKRATESPRVLILTTRLDFASDYISAALIERGVPFLRLNSEDLPALDLCWRPADPRFLVRGFRLPQTVVGPGLNAILVRRPTFLRSPAGCPETVLAAHHWLTFIRGLQAFSGLRWMNHPARDFIAENKMVQLTTAGDVGFRIPSTVVTNSASVALRSLDHGVGLAIKGLDTVLWRDESDQYFGYTEMVNEWELRDLDLSDLPTIVQERIQPKLDVRVTVVGNRVWAAEITAGGAPVDGDWRLLKGRGDYAEHDLPEPVRARCIALTRRLNLEFAAIDLARCDDGYVFFELNPVGEWAWLAEALHWNIADSMAAWLADSA